MIHRAEIDSDQRGSGILFWALNGPVSACWRTALDMRSRAEGEMFRRNGGENRIAHSIRNKNRHGVDCTLLSVGALRFPRSETVGYMKS